MDLGPVEAFVQVAQLRSFSKSADALFLTQPSVTALIQSLERDFGEARFERNGRGVRLTEKPRIRRIARIETGEAATTAICEHLLAAVGADRSCCTRDP